MSIFKILRHKKATIMWRKVENGYITVRFSDGTIITTTLAEWNVKNRQAKALAWH